MMLPYRLQFAEPMPLWSCTCCTGRTTLRATIYMRSPCGFCSPLCRELKDTTQDPRALLLQVGAKLVVLNLSQQTDSGDLLGGFQPVDPSHALLPLLEHFQVRVAPFLQIFNLWLEIAAKWGRACPGIR